MIVIIDRNDMSVNYESNTLCIRRQDQALQRVPLNLLEQLVVYGNPQIEIPVWRALANAAIPTTLLARRGGMEPAVIASGLAVRLPLRRLQYRCAEHADKAIVVARWVLQQKFENYELLLNQFDCEQVQAFRNQRDKLNFKLQQVQTIEGLMGVEGALARCWFALIATLLPRQWRFNGRNRQPPRDPYNSLLSLSYTLLMGEIRQVLISEGLDPAFGFLHQTYPGREALVLDFTELFRGTVDFVMYGLLQQLEPEHFSYSEAVGCRLRKSVRPRYFQAWSALREQCPRVSSHKHVPVETPLAEQIRGKVVKFRALLDSLDGELTA